MPLWCCIRAACQPQQTLTAHPSGRKAILMRRLRSLLLKEVQPKQPQKELQNDEQK